MRPSARNAAERVRVLGGAGLRLNALLFVLLGLQFPAIVDDARAGDSSARCC